MADTNELSLPGSVPVSNIVLGTMYFGSRISQTQSERLLDTFVSMEEIRLILPDVTPTGFQAVPVPAKRQLENGFPARNVSLFFWEPREASSPEDIMQQEEI